MSPHHHPPGLGWSAGLNITARAAHVCGWVMESGTGPSTWQASSRLILNESYKVGTVIIPILQMRVTMSLEGLGNLLRSIHLLCSFQIQPRQPAPGTCSLSLSPRYLRYHSLEWGRPLQGPGCRRWLPRAGMPWPWSPGVSHLWRASNTPLSRVQHLLSVF